MKMFFGTVAALAVVCFAAGNSVEAGDGSWGSAGGSFGSAGGSFGSDGGSWGSAGGSFDACEPGCGCGNCRRAERQARREARRAARAASHGGSFGSAGSHGGSASWGGSHGSTGGSASWGGSYGSTGGGWSSSYGSTGGGYSSFGGGYSSYGGGYGSSGSYGMGYSAYGQSAAGYVANSQARQQAAARVAAATPRPQPTQYALLVLEVPDDAKIYSGDKLVSEAGTTRKFRVPARYNNERCDYNVRVEVVRNGEVSSVNPSGTIEPGKSAIVRIREVDTDRLVAVTSL